MPDPVTISLLALTVSSIMATISLLSLAVSSFTLWLTLVRRGMVRMTQPTMILLGPDIPGRPKVYIRTLLFSTSKQGRIIESMHVRVARNESKQNFNVWHYGDDPMRGSGLFVGETGISTHHHFVAPNDGGEFRFAEGSHMIEVFATLLGAKNAQCLWSQSLQISQEHAAALRKPETWLQFDWGPDSRRYISHMVKRPPAPDGRPPQGN